MNRVGDFYDNAFMESCFRTIETELEMTDYETLAARERKLGSYCSYYNQDQVTTSAGDF